MKATWRTEPDERPTFTQLACQMGDLLEADVKQVYFIPSTTLKCFSYFLNIQRSEDYVYHFSSSE